jgi:putative spermidine/putrescine transport system permease protein
MMMTGVAHAVEQTGTSGWPVHRARIFQLVLVAPTVAYLVVFLIIPYLNIIVMSFRRPARIGAYEPGFTTDNFVRVLTDSYYLGVLAQTLAIGVTTAFICLLLALPIAYNLARGNPRWTGFLYTLVLSPLLVGVVVRTFGWLIILSGNGVINRFLKDSGLTASSLQLMNNEFGVIVGLVHVLLPLMVLPVLSSLQTINPSLELAGRSLGASRATVFRRIVLPLCMPGIQAGTILVFVLAVSAYVTPVMLGGAQVRTMPVLIVQQLIDNFKWPFGAALALILALSVAVVVVIYANITARLMRGLR